jgi:hypothetical protein
MISVKKRIVLDETRNPVAVQISYEDWLVIEEQLRLGDMETEKRDFSRLAGSVLLSEDPLEFQRRLRSEWS